MRDCLYISLFMLHISAGCNLSNKGQIKEVIGYTGGSVLLPCSCDDPKSTVNTFKWEIIYEWKNVFEYEKFRGRLELFNKTSPANLSLLISDLREEDEGIYRCVTETHISSHSFTDVSLTVKGCDLIGQGQTVFVTGYLGESVVLPCSCTEPLTKPDQIKWKFYIEWNYEEMYPSEHIERYKNRRKLLNQTNPRNLSLHLSSLTKEDQGFYQCSVSSNSYIFIRLHVKEKPQVHIIYSSTYQPSQQTHKLTTTQQPKDRKTHQPPKDRITHKSHDIPLHYVILMAVFALVLLLALLAFIYWRYKGGENKKVVTSEAPKLSREPENEDEVEYSSVFHVKTASTPSAIEKDIEYTEYASINVK